MSSTQSILERGQKVLVVCKKDLIEREYIPNWPRDDEGFENPKAFTTEYGWELDGRHICVTHWGCPTFTAEVLESANRLKLIAHAAGSGGGRRI